MSIKKDYPLLYLDEEKEEKKLEKRYQKALIAAKKAADLLKKEYDAKEVWLFGSLAKKERFNKYSDIDLAVRGVAPQKFYSAVGAVTALIREFKVDLIDLEDCKKSLAKAVKKDGVKL